MAYLECEAKVQCVLLQIFSYYFTFCIIFADFDTLIKLLFMHNRKKCSLFYAFGPAKSEHEVRFFFVETGKP